MLSVSCLNKLDAATKGTKQFSNTQALSSRAEQLINLIDNRNY